MKGEQANRAIKPRYDTISNLGLAADTNRADPRDSDLTFPARVRKRLNLVSDRRIQLLFLLRIQ